jgi:hypothetical protein
MRNLISLSIMFITAAVFNTLLLAQPCHADFYATVNTGNATPKAVWVTIYDVTKTIQKDWGCVPVGTSRDWHSGQYTMGGFYYVKGEVKVHLDCTGYTLCDTIVRINPTYHDPEPLGTDVTLYSSADGSSWCYWDHNNSSVAKPTRQDTTAK